MAGSGRAREEDRAAPPQTEGGGRLTQEEAEERSCPPARPPTLAHRRRRQQLRQQQPPPPCTATLRRGSTRLAHARPLLLQGRALPSLTQQRRGERFSPWPRLSLRPHRRRRLHHSFLGLVAAGGGGFPLPAEQQEISCAPTGLGRFFMGGGGVLGTKTGRQAVSGTAQALLCLARGPGRPAGREGRGPWLTPGVPGQAGKAKAPAGQRTLPARRAEGRKGQGGAVGTDGRTADSPVKRGPLPAWVPCRSKEEAALEGPGLPWQCPQGEDAAPTSSWQAGLPFPTCLPPPPRCAPGSRAPWLFLAGTDNVQDISGAAGRLQCPPPQGSTCPRHTDKNGPCPPPGCGRQ